MPADDRLRPKDCNGAENGREPATEPNQQKAMDCDSAGLWRGPNPVSADRRDHDGRLSRSTTGHRRIGWARRKLRSWAFRSLGDHELRAKVRTFRWHLPRQIEQSDMDASFP